MIYQTFPPHPDLAPLVKCYWTLEVPAQNEAQKQRIVPDGCIEMAFILGDDIRRYTSDDAFILQPRAMVLGQTMKPFFIQPAGYVHTFAVRFYPFGFANFTPAPLKNLVNKETPLTELFGEAPGHTLEQKIIRATGTKERIDITERFLLDKLSEQVTIDQIVRTTLDALLSSGGSAPINSLLRESRPGRRQLERKFMKQIGISPKQLGKVIRLQAALKMLLAGKTEKLTTIAYESEYYDQAHFIRDFREFTGTHPKDFPGNDQMALSSLFYREA